MPSPHGELEARALLDLLWVVEPRERRVLILVGEGEQVSEVARSLGLPLGTAFSRLRRGRTHSAWSNSRKKQAKTAA
ncbi:sigma factor-like helix-turn-helix DNA-binding protein [Sorangium sp. So ce1182]|uniref:sigma factor-like helix-turn-helix DNA-binding protein n=1 Tax=Sorangium sp. So ce1182 TaxID=3133334 RepID=UPI003F634A4F